MTILIGGTICFSVIYALLFFMPLMVHAALPQIIIIPRHSLLGTHTPPRHTHALPLCPNAAHEAALGSLLQALVGPSGQQKTWAQVFGRVPKATPSSTDGKGDSSPSTVSPATPATEAAVTEA